ncbi:Yip1-domain-containing protein [Cantharellus anzutake]|uniref:Yip1-domain-containing protein n=1 Tax=Cantharellus anzutake TaxID=1750568 RepID=UPI001904B571|nr:Yip1-domain-containing protein [Cantharellus anzutake]KAF8325176.1 Yip1-domain-containing protein [Cantharellus anzutake]
MSFGGNIQTVGPWWTAFTTGAIEGEPPLLEELGINFNHIRIKSLTVLHPVRKIDEHIMDDADLAGPIVFCFCFALFLLFSGKPQFGYIYGVALMGSVSIYVLLNLMSESGIDAYRVASVLGYCLLPMVGVGAISVVFTLEGTIGYLLSLISILWCTYSASGLFVTVLRMSDQRLLVAYPIGLLYGCFALLSVFNVGVVLK